MPESLSAAPRNEKVKVRGPSPLSLARKIKGNARPGRSKTGRKHAQKRAEVGETGGEMAGRKPKPTAVKELLGNPGKRRVADPAGTEVAELAAEVRSFHTLGGEAAKAFKALRPRLLKLGVLAQSDALALTLLADAYADYRTAEAQILQDGAYYTTTGKDGSTMTRAHPALAVKADAERRIARWLTEFGLTPSARARIASGKEEGQKDPLADFM